jgi:hypothetical protein
MGLNDKAQPFLGPPLHDRIGGKAVGMPRGNLVPEGTFRLRGSRAGFQLQQVKGALQIVHDTSTTIHGTD